MSKIIHGVCLKDDKRGGTVIYKKKNGITEIKIPEDYTKAIFYVRDNESEIDEDEEYELNVKFLKKVMKNKEAKSETKNKNSDDEKRVAYTKEEKQLLGKLGNLDEFECEFNMQNPYVVYEDMTESIMFDFAPISNSVLTSPNGGLWAYHGLRKLHLTISNLLEDVNDTKLQALPKVYFDKKDSKEIQRVESEKIVLDGDLSRKPDAKIYECEYGIYIDTNKLGEELSDEDQNVLFGGYFELTFHWTDRKMQQKNSDITYCIPVDLSINNTKYAGNKKNCVPLQDKTVSIDFGTSSSCVAVEGENGIIELLTLSSNEEPDADIQQINIYENPTYVMLYRWKEIYKQWKRENVNFPFLQRGDRGDEMADKGVQYDFGYSVKDCMDDVNEDELNSILSEIKMIPSILHDGKHLSVRPYIIGEKPVIKLVDSPEKEDEENFDVVAFYAYILGRAINNVAKNKLYTKYNISYPVKFDNELCEKIRKSLEYGLKRSLPLPLRDAKDAKGRDVVQIKMNRAEPVAYIGAICGKYLKLKGDKPELFAVFDFGGGTLDYSFGIFTNDPEDENSAVLHVLHVDGDSNIGGETLIKRMSYWIYSDDRNNKQMIEKNIPFELPIGEIIPDEFSEKLFNESMEAKSNVRKVNEVISRRIFEDRLDDDKESGEEKIELIALNGEEEDIELSYDIQSLNNNLQEVLKEKVLEFRDVMDKTFKTHEDLIKECGGDEYNIRQVNIYKAGNSSKNKLLESVMKETFEENYNEKRIWLIDETDTDFMMDFWENLTGESRKKEKKKIAITPKTAVAIGQINLNRYEVKDDYIKSGNDGAPFAWYVGNKNAGDGSFKIILEKSTKKTEWVKYCKINSTDTKIYCSETYTIDGNSSSVHGIEIDLDEDAIGQFLYLRIVDSKRVAYTVCARGEKPGENDLGNVVELKL